MATSIGFKRVIGTDISEAQLKEAAAKMAGVSNVEFKQAKIEELEEFLIKEEIKG